MEALPQALLFLGIIPALILLYFSLKGFEGLYKDRTIFLIFVAGIIAGFITVLIEYYTVSVGLLFIILFPILEQLFKTMILNIGRFQRKKETTIYGLSLGLGFGSIFIPFAIIISSIEGVFDYYSIALTVLGSFGIILLHGATGVYIGYGVYVGKLPRYFIFAVVLYLPVTTSYLTALFNLGFLQLGLVPYGLIVYWYATKKIMSRILKESDKRKRDKKLVRNK
jgi:hypothetical protein